MPWLTMEEKRSELVIGVSREGTTAEHEGWHGAGQQSAHWAGGRRVLRHRSNRREDRPAVPSGGDQAHADPAIGPGAGRPARGKGCGVTGHDRIFPDARGQGR